VPARSSASENGERFIWSLWFNLADEQVETVSSNRSPCRYFCERNALAAINGEISGVKHEPSLLVPASLKRARFSTGALRTAS